MTRLVLVAVLISSGTAAQFADLPGIGVKTGELIVQYREKNGPFKMIEENPQILDTARFSGGF